MVLIVCLSWSAALSRAQTTAGVSIEEVKDYVFGNYAGEFPSPPHADLNPKRALIVRWKDRPYRFVFAHEGSYCPWFEFPSGAGVCFQFWEGNDGWAELFNDHGRRERNSFIDVMERGSQRVWVRWTYFGVNMNSGAAAYRATEDFYAYANGLVLRRQSYETLMPGKHHGYAREPIELIGMCPAGKLWKDVLRAGEQPDEHHALGVLDAFSPNRYDVYWKAKPGTLWEATARRKGAAWKQLDDAAGVAMCLPLREGIAFCIIGDASGFDHRTTRIKEHSFADTGGNGWVSSCWDHWPIGWLNSQGHVVDAESLKKYPNHVSPVGIDLFAVANQQVAGRDYWSLYGVGEDFEQIRRIARGWLERGDGLKDPGTAP
jgi:hypothetical protein